jgi:hypothetical protein
MKEKFDNIYAILNEAEEDLTKFDEKGNKAAGTRLRKAMQSIKALAQEIRVEVQERKNAEKDAE